MQMTIFNTPVLKTFFQLLSRLLLRVLGWKITGQRPDVKKYVMIAAHIKLGFFLRSPDESLF